MQNSKTLQFWDDIHRQEPAKEWIVSPSNALMQRIVSVLPSPSGEQSGPSVISILEIGCGTSALASELCEFWERSGDKHGFLHVVATDVSPICIEQQQANRRALLQSDAPLKSQLEYKVLDITEANSSKLNSRFNVVLDKGCLDTCLFRSSKANRWVENVLHNIYSWLKPSNSSMYCIVTPRSKLAAVRDFPGFAVTRSTLDKQEFGAAELQANNKVDIKKQQQYMFLCHRKANLNTIVISSGMAALRRPPPPKDDDICGACQITFKSLRQSSTQGRTEKAWIRHWYAHQQHCKATKGGID